MDQNMINDHLAKEAAFREAGRLAYSGGVVYTEDTLTTLQAAIRDEIAVLTDALQGAGSKLGVNVYRDDEPKCSEVSTPDTCLDVERKALDRLRFASELARRISFAI